MAALCSHQRTLDAALPCAVLCVPPRHTCPARDTCQHDMLVQHVFCSAHLAASSCAEAGTALAAVAAGRRSAPTGSTGLTGTFPHDPNIKALGITLAADFGRCLPLPTAVWFLVGAGPSTLPPTSSRRFASARARSRVRSSPPRRATGLRPEAKAQARGVARVLSKSTRPSRQSTRSCGWGNRS